MGNALEAGLSITLSCGLVLLVLLLVIYLGTQIYCIWKRGCTPYTTYMAAQ